MGRRLALLVATYDYEDTGLRRLTTPAHDAEAFAAVLQDPDIAGFEVTTLINEPHYRVGEAISDLYRERRRDDLTLLYFTGHGLKDDDGRLYLATANTRRSSLLFTSLPAEQIDQAMSGSMSRRNVLILDCCYSGAFPAGRTKGDTDVHTLERFQGRGRTVLTASDATQYSFEGNQPQGEAAQSVFTRYLVAGLRDGSADLDGDGDITIDELYSFVHDRVVDEMPQQRPKKQDNVEGRIVIARNVNWSLPAHLRNAIDSPIANARIDALDGLARLYRIGNETVRGTVLEEIRRLATDDSRGVSAAAAAQLQFILPVPLQTPGEPTASHVPDAPQPTILAPSKTTGAPPGQAPQTPLGPAPGMASDGPLMEPLTADTASPPPPHRLRALNATGPERAAAVEPLDHMPPTPRHAPRGGTVQGRPSTTHEAQPMPGTLGGITPAPVPASTGPTAPADPGHEYSDERQPTARSTTAGSGRDAVVAASVPQPGDSTTPDRAAAHVETAETPNHSSALPDRTPATPQVAHSPHPARTRRRALWLGTAIVVALATISTITALVITWDPGNSHHQPHATPPASASQSHTPSPSPTPPLHHTWAYTTGNMVFSSPAVVGGIVYVGSDDGKVYALDAATGTRKWAYATGNTVSSSPAVVGGIVYVGSYDGKVYALDAATGTRKWAYATGLSVYSSPAVVGGIVYVGSYGGKVYALDAATGTRKWAYATGLSVYSSPAVVG
ncbi:caspase, EACC1-associated type, partial [Streptomyces sp. NPDC001070]